MIPIVILAFFALVAGFVNPTPLATGVLGVNLGESVEVLKKYVEPRPEAVSVDEIAGSVGESVQLVEPGFLPRAEAGGEEGGEGGHSSGCGFDTPGAGTACFFPSVTHAEPKLSGILLSLAVVAIGYALAISFCLAYYKQRSPRLVGLTERSRIARGGYLFLENKYYLDHLYESVIVRAIAHPIAKAAYWVNQNVLDGVVNGVGAGGRKTGEWVYNNIDQKVVDGAVKGSGFLASEAGHGLQPVQSGKVNQYGALFFGAAAVGAIVLVILNVS